ncbi:uncharacterized protein MELLADRAFT_87236 [Melampsora larici-populina 98AG31]|uniref:Uncharacterized protein n=1 Tax=Melampsora larici-populina (strain 98AG31 / pathotype 3-4-7) TaxID=747676 RepID=F4R2Y9_MELLP|nr:uncharacterized protein MELLADRAFT_87236 [Melampsora larici-populina 98AG31]EGG12898.1 hypothetical protein MELLADRAFT_87236 [Melampsora larici-populina 98AG31]
MMKRGYWAGFHYWCKVVRSIEGVLGVWHYDEAQNGGFAQLLDRDVEKSQIGDVIHGMMKKFSKLSHLIPFSMPSDRFPVGGGLPQDEDNAEAAANEEHNNKHDVDLKVEAEEEVDELKEESLKAQELEDKAIIEELTSSPVVQPPPPQHFKIKVKLAAREPEKNQDGEGPTSTEDVKPLKRTQRLKKAIVDEEHVKPVKAIRKKGGKKR